MALGGEGKTSLVAKWAVELQLKQWPGCDAAFAWSFYSQGTREQQAASSDLFLKEALLFFGDADDKAFAATNAGAYEKGQRLARIVGQKRSLLILDGLEPLQYAPTSPTPGQLKDQGILALLRGLAGTSRGLCVVTTRYPLPDLKAFWQTTAPEKELKRLSRDAGVQLLETLGVKGTAKECATLVEDVKGHALTLTLFGGFLKRAFHGDIRQRDRVKFDKADEKMDGGHAFRTMAAYEQWLLRDGGDEGAREVAVLRLMGLFDRPADAGCLAALRGEPIPGLTEPLAGLTDDDWNFCLSGLESARLLIVNRDGSGPFNSLDAHPHLREYFAKQLREQQPDAWRAGHKRLYEHLCVTTKEGDQPTLEDLQPLYHAVAHGCHAGMHQEAREKVYLDRILRGNEKYSRRKLGAFGSNLGALACFFESPWSRLSPAFTDVVVQALLYNEAGFALRAFGRLTESIELMRAALEKNITKENWRHAAFNATNVSELELTLGAVVEALGVAEQSVTYADRSGDAHWKSGTRSAHAASLHQAGRRAEAETRFCEAERMQAANQPVYPLLYSLIGFKYCDLLLTEGERATWRDLLGRARRVPSWEGASVQEKERPGKSLTLPEGLACYHSISKRAAQTLKWVTGKLGLLDEALDHLTLGRAAIYEAILEGSPLDPCNSLLDAAVSGFRRAGTQDHLPEGLLTRAWLRALTGAHTGPESAQADLDEAWEIAERGPMRLHMADIHLYRARLFYREKKYPWESPQHDLAEARKLIEKCGYGRRKEELEDAEKAILGKSPGG